MFSSRAPLYSSFNCLPPDRNLENKARLMVALLQCSASGPCNLYTGTTAATKPANGLFKRTRCTAAREEGDNFPIIAPDFGALTTLFNVQSLLTWRFAAQIRDVIAVSKLPITFMWRFLFLPPRKQNYFVGFVHRRYFGKYFGGRLKRRRRWRPDLDRPWRNFPPIKYVFCS